ncbi:MAG: hypothetical protein JOZ72_14420 [Alphaproteobacteria bacterium]|nr:hypothetical protein [Alphaproteobacteria bacterium]
MTRAFLAAAFAASLAGGAHAAATVTFLHVFDGADGGCGPQAGVTFDSAGNLYGTTASCGALQRGTIYKLAPDGTFSVLSDFSESGAGLVPEGEMSRSHTDNFFGTTIGGGANNGGTLFRFRPAGGRMNILHAFADGAGGRDPRYALLRDRDRTIYGVAIQGGSTGLGTVYKLTEDGTYAVLHDFTNFLLGETPSSNLVADAQGNLYGAAGGGPNDAGIIYKIAAGGAYSILYAFGSVRHDGTGPNGPIAIDDDGNIYGTAGGGRHSSGVVYRVAPDGTETMLHVFGDSKDDGIGPNGLMLSRGALYGTTWSIPDDVGTVFKYAITRGRFRTLCSFNGTKGELPAGRLRRGPDGAIYGVTQFNTRRPSAGTIFKLVEGMP